jgi:hypothetical protein
LHIAVHNALPRSKKNVAAAMLPGEYVSSLKAGRVQRKRIHAQVSATGRCRTIEIEPLLSKRLASIRSAQILKVSRMLRVSVPTHR